MIQQQTPGTRIVFREAVVPADVEAVRGIVADTGFFSAEEVAIAAELVEERLQKGPASGYEFIFAEVDGIVKGYSCYGLIPCSTVSWDLYWIAVAPDQQGSGLGRRVLDLTEQRIAQSGGLAVYAETSGREQYTPTRGFYGRCGYATGAVFEDFYGPGDAKYVFVKRMDRKG
ncbi:MAG: N-acetyltransferase family protein [Candidatus Krumholzibacteriia bacterium]